MMMELKHWDKTGAHFSINGRWKAWSERRPRPKVLSVYSFSSFHPLYVLNVFFSVNLLLLWLKGSVRLCVRLAFCYDEIVKLKKTCRKGSFKSAEYVLLPRQWLADRNRCWSQQGTSCWGSNWKLLHFNLSFLLHCAWRHVAVSHPWCLSLSQTWIQMCCASTSLANILTAKCKVQLVSVVCVVCQRVTGSVCYRIRAWGTHSLISLFTSYQPANIISEQKLNSS